MYKVYTNIIRGLLIAGLVIAMIINYVYIIKAEGYFSKPINNLVMPTSIIQQAK